MRRGNKNAGLIEMAGAAGIEPVTARVKNAQFLQPIIEAWLASQTREVLQDILGYDAKDVDKLASDGVVQIAGD